MPIKFAKKPGHGYVVLASSRPVGTVEPTETSVWLGRWEHRTRWAARSDLRSLLGVFRTRREATAAVLLHMLAG